MRTLSKTIAYMAQNPKSLMELFGTFHVDSSCLQLYHKITQSSNIKFFLIRTYPED